MAGSLTREWQKGNRRVDDVAFLAPRLLSVPTGLKIGGNSRVSSDDTLLSECNIPRLGHLHLLPQERTG